MALGTPKSMLEEEYAPAFTAWKADPTPDTTGALLTAAEPVIRAAAKRYLGDDGPLAHGSARRAFVSAIGRYDPAKAKLATFTYSQLQGLSRQANRADRGIKVSDRVAADKYRVEQARMSLSHELGRDPTDDEIMDEAAVSPRRFALASGYAPAVAQSALDSSVGASGLGGYDARALRGRDETAPYVDLLYHSVDPTDRRIIDLAFGRTGRAPAANQDIATKLKLTPGAISQRKAKLQAMLDELMASELL